MYGVPLDSVTNVSKTVISSVEKIVYVHKTVSVVVLNEVVDV